MISKLFRFAKAKPKAEPDHIDDFLDVIEDLRAARKYPKIDEALRFIESELER